MGSKARGRHAPGREEPSPNRDDEGWLTVPELLSAAEADSVVDRCRRWAAALSPTGDRRGEVTTGDKPVGGTVKLANMHQRDELIADIMNRAGLVAAARSLAGGDLDRLVQVEAAYRCPGPGFGAQELHADAVARTDPAALSRPADAVTALVALVDFTADNGATRLVPGSHRRLDLQKLTVGGRTGGSLAGHPDERILTGPAGTAFVFSGHILHSGTLNRSSQPRLSLQITWRAGAAPSMAGLTA